MGLHNAVLNTFTAMITFNTSSTKLSSKNFQQDLYSPLSVWLDNNAIYLEKHPMPRFEIAHISTRVTEHWQKRTC